MRNLNPSSTSTPRSSPLAPTVSSANKARRASSVVSDSGSNISVSQKKPPSPRRPIVPSTPSRAPRIIASAVAASTVRRPPTLASTLRTPLRPKDRNALPVKAPPTATMPVEKAGASARPPQMPTLAAKGTNRTPLTPKIATKTTAPVVTPVARRTRDSNAAGGFAAKEEYASPVSTFLGSNVTPRSGSRQSRVDSANTTPNGTPFPERHDWDTRSGLGISGSGVEGELPRRAATFSPSSDCHASARQDDAVTADSKFFYASDAKPPQQPVQPRVAGVQQKSSTFFYANANSVGGNRTSPPSVTAASLTPVLGGAAPEVNSTSKFVYANGTPDLQAQFKPTFSSPGPGSVVSTSSKVAPVRTGASTPAGTYPTSQRPGSPVKLAQQPSLQSLTGGALPPPSAMARPPTSNPSVVGAPVSASRKTSIDAMFRGDSHSRSTSLTAADAPAVAKFVASYGSGSSEASSPASTSNPGMTMASIVQTAEELTEGDESRQNGVHSELHSPTKSTQGGDHLSELVASARRERKVQDLEITNASLEAINRSLERQLRKQTTELRRYRRLSRSGRLSILSLASSGMGPPESVVGPPSVEGFELSDFSEEENMDEEIQDSIDETDLSDTDSASVSDGLSPDAKETRDARHRKRDERRLQLDLSKHRQLLVDSQKMNQSLKRCMNWTEELIREGRKALEYRVRVSDIELGGRVLAPHLEEDEVDQDEDGDDTLHGIGATSNPGLSPPWNKSSQDRDSGIELPVDGG